MTKQYTSKPTPQSGFTLIELSIVLVIIGLIVGGVLVGQDMIKAAQIRATVTQIERYNTAANTFRGKYNGLPGDVINGNTFFSSVAAQSNSLAGAGNGDGLIQSLSGAAATCATLNCVAGENILFWYELSQANLIPDAITNVAANFTYTTVNSVISSSIIPNAKVNGQISVQAANGLNYWILAAISGTDAAGIPGTIAASLTPLQAYQIDTKIDDGAPDSGLVQSITGSIPGVTAAAGVNNLTTAANVVGATCGTSDTHVYALTSLGAGPVNNANTVDCQLEIRTNF